MPESAYAWHERLVAPARSRSELWRLPVALIIAGLVVFALNAAVMGAIATYGSDGGMGDFLTGGTPVAMLILLGTFGFVTLGVGVAARLIHRRGLGSIIGPAGETIRQFWRVLRLLLVLLVALYFLPPYDMGVPLEPNLPPATWAMLLPFSLTAVLVQTSAEEILFRGYIQQSLAARFRSRAVWMGVPSALFALGHYLPGAAGDNAWLIAVWSGAFGLLAADLTARAGTLGPAVALHFFNNVFALLFIALPGNLAGLALFHLPYDMSDTENLRIWFAVDFAMMVVTWLVARIAIRR